MYIYIYIYMCVCVCVYMCIYICVCVCVNPIYCRGRQSETGINPNTTCGNRESNPGSRCFV